MKLSSLIESIHASGYQAVMVVSGGGSGAVDALLRHPGASRFMLETHIPYSAESMGDYLGVVPQQACSETTARLMLNVAFDRAKKMSKKPLAVSCTAALQTTRTRRGADRAFIGIKTDESENLFEFNPTTQSRDQQENELSEFLLRTIAEAVDTAV